MARNHISNDKSELLNESGPHDHGISPLSHTGTCSDQVDTRCYLGWRPVPEKPGSYHFDRKIYEQVVKKRERDSS